MIPILNMKPYSVMRTTAPDAVRGRPVPGVETTILITANVQPIGKKLKSVPEARWGEDLKWFLTATELYIADTVIMGVHYNCDQIIIKGLPYEVFQIDDWGGHFQCFAARQTT